MRIALRRFEAIRANHSHVLKIGGFLRIDSRESARSALRITGPSKGWTTLPSQSLQGTPTSKRGQCLQSSSLKMGDFLWKNLSISALWAVMASDLRAAVPGVSNLKTTPTPNKTGSHRIKRGFVCHSFASVCPIFCRDLLIFKATFMPYGPPLYGASWGHISSKYGVGGGQNPGRNYIPQPPLPPFRPEDLFQRGGGGVYFEAPCGRFLYAPPLLYATHP